MATWACPKLQVVVSAVLHGAKPDRQTGYAQAACNPTQGRYKVTISDREGLEPQYSVKLLCMDICSCCETTGVTAWQHSTQSGDRTWGNWQRRRLPPGKDRRLPPKGGAALKCLLRAGMSSPFSLVIAPSRSETQITRPPLTWIISAAHAPTFPNPCMPTQYGLLH